MLGGRLGSSSVLESEYEATVHRSKFGLCRSIIGGSYPRIAIVNQLGEQLGGDGGLSSVGCGGSRVMPNSKWRR
ncbi:MAG: hypothetical protein QOE04_2969, partial [Mycobacterium sp.]|nr:hypothetical protein [Mycobacterium sp.]